MDAKMWLDQFKIALINQNLEKLISLQTSQPSFLTLDEMQTAAAFIKQALLLFKNEQLQMSQSMRLLKKNIEFQKSTIHLENRFSIES
jgi:hypothetical protein